MRNPNWDNIMVKAENNGTAIVLHTYERQYGRSSGFYIITEHLRKWYANDPELIFHDADGVSTIKMWCKGQTCHIQISWLRFHEDRELRGHVQRFTITERALRHLMIDGASIRELCRPEERRAKIDASMPTTNDLRRVLHDAANIAQKDSNLNAKIRNRIIRCQVHRRLLFQILTCICAVLGVSILAICFFQ